MYKVLDVCLFIIHYCNEKGYNISNLKLQKLLYFIQAYFLVKLNFPCFTEKIEAWDFGPVVPKAYHEFKRFGSGLIPPVSFYYLIDDENAWNIRRVEFNEELILTQHREMIIAVVDSLANFSATDLVSITHEQAPWKETYIPRMNMEISVEFMREYFNEK